MIYPFFFTENVKYYPIQFVEFRFVTLPDVIQNYYMVSNMGIVKNIRGQEIKPCLLNSGYYDLRLATWHGDPKYKHITVHRLVMLTFCPIENPELYTVNHKNYNTADNRLINLEWMTNKSNNLDKMNSCSYRTNDSNAPNALFTREEVLLIKSELSKKYTLCKYMQFIRYRNK